MMGPHHAACGAAAWVAMTTRFHIDLAGAAQVLPFLPHGVDVGLGLLHVSAVGVVTGALVTAGAALVPDADHRNATIAHSLPPVSNIVCREIGKASGGHRHGTHSVLGIFFFILVALLAGLWTLPLAPFGTIYPGAGLLSVLLVSFAAKVLRIIPDSMRKFPWLLGLAAGVFITFFAPQEQGWFPLAVGVGAAVHIVGDMLTTGGCNLIWPLRIKPPTFLRRIPVVSWVWKPSGYLAVPVLGHAGSWREWLLLVPVSLYAVLGMGGALFAVAGVGAA
ncbi:metal-dependent hydrolase [Specibacter cremeus]|uniref:metal-dependent hydrolase n=1 Tax=Specibacter cremeus TaxID=1629051 RepID=UPI000F7B5790|nr:metal-dependent hydrolase [Specibacter cremeus]